MLVLAPHVSWSGELCPCQQWAVPLNASETIRSPYIFIPLIAFVCCYWLDVVNYGLNDREMQCDERGLINTVVEVG